MLMIQTLQESINMMKVLIQQQTTKQSSKPGPSLKETVNWLLHSKRVPIRNKLKNVHFVNMHFREPK